MSFDNNNSMLDDDDTMTTITTSINTANGILWRHLVAAAEEIESSPSRSPSQSPSDDVNFHYVSRVYTVLAFTLTAIGVALCIGSCFFIFLFRNNHIISVGQPPFLYLICFGALLMSVSICLNAVDDSTGRTQESLDATCIAWIWCTSVGEIIVYMALVCKLWRVEKVTKFRRGQTILVKHVIGPFIAVILVTIGVLIAWTVASPPYYTRQTITGFDGELQSIGICYYEDGGIFKLVLTIIFILSVSVAFWLSWKTRNVPEYLSDSRRVTQTLLGHLVLSLILFVGNLIFILVPATDSDSAATSLHTGIFLSTVFYEFFVAMISIGFLVIPKIYYVRYKQIHGTLPAGVHKIGGRVTIMVNNVQVDLSSLPPVITQRSTEGSPKTRKNDTPNGISEQSLAKEDQYDYNYDDDDDDDDVKDGSQNFRMEMESSISDDNNNNDIDGVENNI